MNDSIADNAGCQGIGLRVVLFTILRKKPEEPGNVHFASNTAETAVSSILFLNSEPTLLDELSEDEQ
ncbi:MAG: hypothetical protein ACXV7F_04630 [Methylomonas sp.]